MNKKDVRRKMLSLMGTSNAWAKDTTIRKRVQVLGRELVGENSKKKPTKLQRNIIKLLKQGKYLSQIADELSCSEIYAYEIKERWKAGEWDDFED